MNWLIESLCISLLVSGSWMILGTIYAIQSGDLTFLITGAVIFALINVVMAIYILRRATNE